MKEIIVIVLLILGTLFIFVSAVGLLRMPDLYTRLSTTTKANAVGIAFIIITFIIYFNRMGIVTQSVTAFLFLALTIPIAGHFIARVAYMIGIKKQQGNENDALHQKFGTMKKDYKKKDC